jgi:hypothetical protein
MPKAGARKVRRAGPRRITLRIALRYVEPSVWREISLPDFYTLEQLHRCVQLTFNWLDYHLFEFQVGPRRFQRANPEADGEDAATIQLADLNLRQGTTFVYAYDMGDGWEHDIVVQTIQTDQEENGLAYTVGGARAAPPEDVGGPPGYERLLLAFQRRSTTEDEDLIAWAGPDFVPELFDLRACNHALILATAWGVI